MGLMQAIKPYIEATGLVISHKVDPDTSFNSGNGLMYTSEFYIMAYRRGLLKQEDINNFEKLVLSCIGPSGALNRNPLPHESGQEGPDDYYAILNACIQLGIVSIPRIFLKSAMRHLGALNNVQLGKWTPQSFLLRQPGLVATLITACFPSLKNPLHYLIRALFFPFYLITAIIIALSGISAPIEEVDSRRLAWHLAESTDKRSLLCFLASKIWFNRLKDQYGDNGMKTVATLYYEKGHPFATYWVQ